MKKILQKSLSVFLGLLMMLTVLPALALATETEAAVPAITIEKTSETPTQLVVTVKLTENLINCLDMQIASGENLELKAIEILCGGSSSFNVSNGKISIANSDDIVAPAAIAVYTFDKLNKTGATADSIDVTVLTCYIEADDPESNGVDVTDTAIIVNALPEEHTHISGAEWGIVDTPTCGTEGTEALFCTECGNATETRPVPTTEHKNTTTETTPPTCTEDGLEKVYCNDCEKYVAENTLTSPGHVAADTDLKLPTCTEPGYEKLICSCGHVISTTVLNPTDHLWIDDVKTPTCTEDGYIRKYCPACQSIENEQAIGHTDHSWSDWEIVKKPTYSATGIERRICGNCGTDEERVAPKLVAEVSQLVMSQTEISMNFRGTSRLFVNFEPEEAAYSTEIIWTSSNENVATVSEDGAVYGANLGTATITASTPDGSVIATCEVEVKYSFLQWIIVYILFGWIWYL
ncbi:MAG: Ig-like domain-containing protein [Clostridia bacterium]|nr:Ig-like domain-containing protein [Clostridia bacterium]